MVKDAWNELCGERILSAIRTDVRHPFDDSANGCAIELDDMTVFVFEDPSDGYRSSATEPMVCRGPLWSFGCQNIDYLRIPVRVQRWTASEYDYVPVGIELIDRRNGQVILRLGTDNSDDYYPSYTCDWRPQNIAMMP